MGQSDKGGPAYNPPRSDTEGFRSCRIKVKAAIDKLAGELKKQQSEEVGVGGQWAPMVKVFILFRACSCLLLLLFGFRSLECDSKATHSL